MPLTTLDPVTALVVIDMQKGIMMMPTAHPSQEIAARIGTLAKAFRERGQPVVLVHVTGGAPGRVDAPSRMPAMPADWTELIPALGQQPSDHLVTKVTWGAFYGTSLDLHLRRRQVHQVVICGIATSIGVESTAREAYERGYHVVLVADAMTDRDPDSHRHSIEKIFPRLGEVTTTDALVAMLSKRS